MKKIVFIITIASVLGLTIFKLAPSTIVKPPASDTSLPKQEKLNNNEKIHPYSIEALSQREYPSDGFVSQQSVGENEIYRSYIAGYLSEGLTQYALLHVPKKQNEKMPVVIVNHGYIDPDVYSTVNSYQNTSAYYARRGFVVAKPDYRGHDNSQGDPREPLSRVKYAVDVMYLVSALEKEDYVDPEKIFLYGHSMGGDVSLRLLEISDKFAAASLWAPAVTTFPESQLYFVRKNRNNELEKRKDELNLVVKPSQYEEISAFTNTRSIGAPLLVHHGTNDQSVPYQWSQELVDKLQKEGKEVTFYSYPNDNHDIAANFSRALARDVEFFNQN